MEAETTPPPPLTPTLTPQEEQLSPPCCCGAAPEESAALLPPLPLSLSSILLLHLRLTTTDGHERRAEPQTSFQRLDSRSAPLRRHCASPRLCAQRWVGGQRVPVGGWGGGEQPPPLRCCCPRVAPGELLHTQLTLNDDAHS